MKGKTIIAFVFLAGVLLGLTWYNHQFYRYGYPFVQMPSGFSYKRMNAGNGRKIQQGEWMACSFVISVADKKDQPAQAQPQPHKGVKTIADNPNALFLFDDTLIKQHKHLAELIGMVEEKQRVVFKFSPQYYLADMNPLLVESILKYFQLKTDDTLLMDVAVNKIFTKIERMEMVKKEKEKRIAQFEIDKKLIKGYLKEHNIQANVTDTGLFYSIDEPSEDIPVVQNKTVEVHYTGKFLDGTVFDTSIAEVAKAHSIYTATRSYEPLKFLVGGREVIAGWDQGLLLLKKNEKARFFIPSSLAYGEEGQGQIPPNAVLLFEIQVVNVED